MARVKIKEYKAKEILYKSLNINLNMASLSNATNQKELHLDKNKRYVVKVDQGVKGRLKKGLIALNKKYSEIEGVVNDFKNKGYDSYFVEENIPHKSQQEHYLSIERVRDGNKVLYSLAGGIDIEKKQELIKTKVIKAKEDVLEVSKYLKIDNDKLIQIIELFDKNHFSFLEINPIVVIDKNFYILDLAVEVDSVAEFFVENAWTSSDFISETLPKTIEEKEISQLAQKSQAAFKLDVINKDGSIFMLLSGGGASIVLADEVYNLGFAKCLANYGEYSGNPNAEETYIYTKNLLSLLISSKSKDKVLIIGGGVANFTDIRITFNGVIKALSEVKNELKSQNIKVFVRRGGPHQEEGLENISEFLKKNNLYGNVFGPEIVLTDVVSKALASLKKC